MYNDALSIPTTRSYIPEQRKNLRERVAKLITINAQGTGQVINIWKSGLSFGCLYHHSFPEEWTMDLLDARGSHIKNLKVRKVWEVSEEDPCTIESFDIRVRVEFVHLSKLQTEALNSLLSNY